MHLREHDLRIIAARAASLRERLEAARGVAEIESPPDEALHARWARWEQLLGGNLGLAERIAAHELTVPECRKALGANRLRTSLPDWTITFRKIVEGFNATEATIGSDTVDDLVNGTVRDADPLARAVLPFTSFARNATAAVARDSFRQDLAEQLCDIARRPFLLEAQRAAATTNPIALQAASEEECLRYAEALLNGQLVAFFLEYSVLARLLTSITTHWIDECLEFEARLAADRAEIDKVFGVAGERVSAVEPGLSDAHNGGRRVSKLTFANGCRVLYKPKAAGPERAYDVLVNWLNSNGAPFVFRAPVVLERPDYSWAEFIETEPCLDDDGLSRYHQRLGALIAVAHVFGGSDLHVENVLPAGDLPVAVDTETFPQPLRKSWCPRSDDWRLEDSLLRTGVLPVWYPGVNGMSKAPLPLRDGSRVPLVAHLGTLDEGFRATYEFLRRQQSLLLVGQSPVETFGRHMARYVHRATAVYDFLLKRAAYPKFLREGVDRSIEFEILGRSCLSHELSGEAVPWAIFREETRALEQLDIPCFSTHSDGHALYAGAREIVPRAFETSGIEGIRERLNTLDDDDLEFQRRCLAAAVHARTATMIPPGPVPDATAAIDLTGAARKIGATIIARGLPGYRSPKMREWITLHRMSDHELMRIHMMGNKLYDGRAGLALFLAALDGENHGVIRAALHPILNDAPGEPTIGAASGVGGQVYALVHIARLLGREEYLDAAIRLVEQITNDRIDKDTSLDAGDGTAGALLGILALHEATRDAHHLERAIRCGAQLVRQRVVTPSGHRAWLTLEPTQAFTGLSHGAAGIAMALLRLWQTTGDDQFRQAAVEGMAFETASFSARHENWPDWRGVTAARPLPTFQSTWCHGATGIGLARLRTLDIHDTPQVREDIEVALRASQRVTMLDADHVCCGSMARIEFLFEAGVRLQRPSLVDEAIARAAGIVARADAVGTYALHSGVTGETTSFSFFHGVAGIGYSLLRLSGRRDLPCVLQWA